MNNGKSTSFDAMHIHLKNFGDYRILKMGSKQIWLCLEGDKTVSRNYHFMFYSKVGFKRLSFPSPL
jgi:hypothetical protein